jgi:hypothetical protein
VQVFISVSADVNSVPNRALALPLHLLFIVICAFTAAALADDFGPHRDIAQVRAEARRLLAQRTRNSGLDPAVIQISDAVVVNDQAVLSWSNGKQRGLMGLVREMDRWWDAMDAVPAATCWSAATAYPLDAAGLSKELLSVAVVHNIDVRVLDAPCKDSEHAASFDTKVKRGGGTVHVNRSQTAGYDITIAYAASNAASNTTFSQIYARAPTRGEMLQNPTPPHGVGGPNAVLFFDLTLDSSAPIAFERGTKVDIWFPFVLDDALRYDMTFTSDGKVVGPVYATIFDNVLHYELPAFSVTPAKPVMAEIDGNW